MKKKLSCTTPYGTFTRTTAHEYTHVVVTCGYDIARLEATIADAEKRYAKHGAAPHQLSWLEGVRVQVTLSRDLQTAGRGKDAQWCHSERLAQKAAGSIRNSENRNVVGIFPVTQEAL